MGPLTKELTGLRKNHAHLNEKMDGMSAAFWAADPYGCCPGCAFGSEWHRMEESQSRRERRIGEIEARISRDSAN